jgi:cytochrome c biogenesis protein
MVMSAEKSPAWPAPGVSSFNPGRFVDGTGLAPYSLTLDDFQVSYRLPGTPGAGQAEE